MLIISLSFGVMASTLNGILGKYLVDQRIRADKAGLEKWATDMAALLFDADTREISNRVAGAANELSGRVLLLDGDGKVLSDSFRQLNGSRLNLPEVAGVLVQGKTTDYGIYSLKNRETGEIDLQSIRRSDDQWVSLCTAGVVHASKVIGVMVLITSVHEMMSGLFTIQDRMMILFVVVAAAAILSGMVFSRILTRPIVDLTRGIQRMGKGDFSSRVEENGSGEIKHLAQAFNSMSEKLEALDMTRNQFVSDASHELKTPLATMKIMVESLVYQPDMEEELRTEFLTDVNKEIDRLSAIVSDLLTLVQSDAQIMKLTREKMSLSTVIKEAIHRLQPILEKNKQIFTLILEDPCDMYADAAKLAQVAYNLMENAAKYTQLGGTITVQLSRVGKEAVFSVKDNGPGISKENIGHVFERFFRVDKARSRDTGGTGLGLSIVQQIVTLHSGSISVESEEGQGSMFTVKLPLHKG